jgi:hypothetical protein
MPSLNKKLDIIDEAFETDLSFGPGISPLGDVLWNPNMEGQETAVVLSLRGYITTRE